MESALPIKLNKNIYNAHRYDDCTDVVTANSKRAEVREMRQSRTEACRLRHTTDQSRFYGLIDVDVGRSDNERACVSCDW
ncbi:hypothetical protein J6590_060353 [Homalodisca vitripennis]|nr:hypothetical protein J6590_060353 [Homalodisca vitripennis]